MHKERMAKLKRVIKRTPADKINMNNWYCGTAACVLGHYSLSKEGIEDGWTTDDMFIPTWNNTEAFKAAEEYFEIDYRDAERLFDPCEYQSHFENGRIPKIHVLRRIDEIIGENE